MKNLYWSVAGTLGLALLVGCGGGGATSTTTTTSTGGTTGTTPVTYPAAGNYTGTYTSAVFAQGGPSTAGPSGNSTLAIADDGTFTLTLGDATVQGLLTGTGTTSAAFTGTFTDGSATASVRGTVTKSATRTVVRFSNYTDSSQSSGTLYSASLS